jgi:8-oxo-dGTP pyrophosphatase MutT (NUDIX family)
MVPEGVIETREEPVAAALREFEEETGLKPPPISHALTACANPVVSASRAGPPRVT